MASCPKCGSKMAFGAKRSVAPALDATVATLGALRKASGQLPGPEEFSIDGEAERAKSDQVRSRFLGNVNSLISDGERLESALHQVAHNMSASINWPEVNGWLGDAHRAVAAAYNY